MTDSIQEHPWVTRGGIDPLLSTEENTANLVEPPTQAEMDGAITGNFRQLLAVVRYGQEELHTSITLIGTFADESREAVQG
jgi:hypothetical protein